jgi:hypothetical protein
MHKGVKCLDVSTGRIYISRDVVFDENVFPFASLHPNAGALLKQQILLLPTSTNEGVQNIANHVPIIPITDAQQNAETAEENCSSNGTQNSAEIRFQQSALDDELGVDPEEDPPRHSPCTGQSEEP